MNASRVRPDTCSTATMNPCCMAAWKAPRVSRTMVLRWFDHRFDVDVDAFEDARKQVAAKQSAGCGPALLLLLVRDARERQSMAELSAGDNTTVTGER
jgi:hypothetical protein